jgi:acetyl-CoA acetyltransferase family protein
MSLKSNCPESVAVVAGMRTPFAKAFGALAAVPADELGRVALTAALDRAGWKPSDVDEVIFGNVASPPDTPNISRVIALKAGIPQDRVAHTVHRNCASGMEAIVSAGQSIHEGRAAVVVAGGTESMSNVPLLWDARMKELLLDLSRQKTLMGKLRVITRFRPSMLRPIPALQLGLIDPTCGLNMGQTAEVLAKDFGISREEQDRFALSSHQRATAAWERCFYKGEVAPVPLARPRSGGHESLGSASGSAQDVTRDTGPRANQTLEALAKLKPLFEPASGSVTAGNSCPITDGACALLLLPPGRASGLGLAPLGFIRDYALAGCEPRRMGLGPVHATHKLLTRHGLKLSDFDLFEINEAFAAQVIACQRAFASAKFAQEHFDRTQALGEIPSEKLNVNGGAIALGHPVGTTGARLVLTLLRALREKGLQRGLATLCIGGGQGMAMWLETESNVDG